MSSPISCDQCYLEQEEVGYRDGSCLDPIDDETLLSNLHKRFKQDQIYVSTLPCLSLFYWLLYFEKLVSLFLSLHESL